MATNQYQKLMIMGNLGKDQRFFPAKEDGTPAMVSGSICSNSQWPQRDQQGNILKDAGGKTLMNEAATWIPFVIRGRRAEPFSRFMAKGKPYWMEGELREREYNSHLALYPCYNADGTPVLDANGQHFHAYVQVKRKELYLRVVDWGFLGSKEGSNAYAQQAGVPAQGVAVGAPVMGQPAPGVPVPPQPQVQTATPQNVQAAFTGQTGVVPQQPVQQPVQPQVQTGVQPQQFTVDPSHLPSGV